LGEGLYQPKILSLNEKQVLQSTGNMIHIFGFGFAKDKGKKDEEVDEEIKKIGYASGTCLFASRSVLDKVGLLDSFLFLYHDDLDLGWRASQIGINSYYVPKSKIYHVESYSLKWSEKKFYWLERNRKYCLLTHYSKSTYAKMYSSLCLVDLFVWFFYISKGFLGAKIRAELDIRRNKKFIETKYQELEEKKIISDEKLIQEFPDEIFVPTNVSDNFMNKSFNSILSKLSKKVKKKII
jgi:GT2 family glycosyltransferase